MVTVRTDLGDLKESARRLRVEQAGGLTDTDVQDALETLQSEITSATAAPTQRQVASTGDLPIQASDQILNVNVTAPLTIPIPAASTRNGKALIFKDIAGNWATNNITFNRAGADTFDGLSTLVGRINYGRLTLVPINDGINAGYEIQDANLS